MAPPRNIREDNQSRLPMFLWKLTVNGKASYPQQNPKKRDSKFKETKNILVGKEPYCPKPSSLFALFLSRFGFANSQTNLYYKNVKRSGGSTDFMRAEVLKGRPMKKFVWTVYESLREFF